MIGQTLGSYRITGKLGEGGMGIVYVGEHTLLGRKAAVKLLLPKYSDDKNTVRRFFNEARSASSVKHPGIVDIYDYGETDDGRAFIIMELLEGISLSERIEQGGPMPPLDVIRLGRQAADALDAAHRQGIVHRDLKPDNIFLVPDSATIGGERVKVLDFGIAKLSESAARTGSGTATGAVLGSPRYMSPEQCRGAEHVDARSDVYSFGCVLYHMATGRSPFEADSSVGLIAAHLVDTPVPPEHIAPAVAGPLSQIILRTMAKNPTQRFASMAELVEALDACSGGRFASTQFAIATPRGDSSGIATNPSWSGPFEAAPRRSRTPWLVALVIVIAGASAAIGLSVGRDGERAVAAPVVADVTAEHLVAVDVGDAAPPAAPGDATLDATPTTTAAATEVVVHIDSTPSGASVWLGDDRVGETPYSSSFKRQNARRTFTLRHDGYQPLKVRVNLHDDADERVDLVAVKHRPVARPSGRTDKLPSGPETDGDWDKPVDPFAD